MSNTRRGSRNTTSTTNSRTSPIPSPQWQTNARSARARLFASFVTGTGATAAAAQASSSTATSFFQTVMAPRITAPPPASPPGPSFASIFNTTSPPVTRSFTRRKRTISPTSTITLSSSSSSSDELATSPSPAAPQSSQKLLTTTAKTPVNLVQMLVQSQLGASRRTASMPAAHFSCMHDATLDTLSERLCTLDYPQIMKRLDQSSVTTCLRNGSKEALDLLQIIKEIEYRLVHYDLNQRETAAAAIARATTGTADLPAYIGRDGLEVETINIESARVFRSYGGVQLFKRILLLCPPILVDDDEQHQSSSPSSRRRRLQQLLRKNEKKNCCVMRITCKCIYILDRLICLPKFGRQVVYDLLNVQPQFHQQSIANNTNLTYDTAILQHLFSLLLMHETRLPVCQLIESILLHIPMLNLNKINNICHILDCIDDEGLSCICKIFAVTLSDLDFADRRYWVAGGGAAAATTAQTTRQQQPQQREDGSATSTTLSQEAQSQLPVSIRDQNQELLLALPGFLDRLVKLVRRRDYAMRNAEHHHAPHVGASGSSEMEYWIRYIDQSLDQELAEFLGPEEQQPQQQDETSDDEEVFPQPSFASILYNSSRRLRAAAVEESSSSSEEEQEADTDHRHPPHDSYTMEQPALLAASKLNSFVHVLYTLSLLLTGKERKRVQRELANLRLAAALNGLFDFLIWNCRCESTGHELNNNVRSHICPEVAIKIQFLRLMHSFCDHNDMKRVVLSHSELAEIKEYNRTAAACLRVSEQVYAIDAQIVCTQQPVGLLSKIIQVIKMEPFSASFRFWLTRAIESYLRGGPSYADQLFLIKRGVVEDTVRNLLATNFARSKEVLQSSFDMLGELVKFNVDGFALLNSEINDTEKFDALLRMINQSLVDSNMFLRSIFLTIDFFETNSASLNYKLQDNKVLSYFDKFERRVWFVCRMINTINLHNLSQENVSCMNTTLVVLMLASRRSLLPKYLQAIKARAIEVHQQQQQQQQQANSDDQQQQQQPTDLLTNFKELLAFWQQHYLQKERDCVGLEQSSRIEFVFWKQTVETLLDPDAKNECSLNYYIQNEPNAANKPKGAVLVRCD